VNRRRKARPETRREKTFSLHWGSGIIEEEVQIATPYHVPTIQLLKFNVGPAAGTRSVRFCHYDTRGRFQRSPLIVDQKDIEALAAALTKAKAPRLRMIFAMLGSLRGGAFRSTP
jgi:hypothetical protein